MRVVVVAVLVMAVTLTVVAVVAVVAVVTWRPIQVGERGDVDVDLRQRLADVGAGLPSQLAAAAVLDGVSSPVERQLAARRYLTTAPGSEQQLTVLDVGGDPLVTAAGPVELRRLRDAQQLPAGEPGTIRTVATDEGPVRVLVAGLVTDDGSSVGAELSALGSPDGEQPSAPEGPGRTRSADDRRRRSPLRSGSATSPGTWVGSLRAVASQSPSWPISFPPQHQTLRSVRVAQVCGGKRRGSWTMTGSSVEVRHARRASSRESS